MVGLGTDAQAAVYRAENAYAALKKNPRHQKYRDRWLACIEKYQKVYRLDPSGPWAAAGLYRSGRLYLELHKRSYCLLTGRKPLTRFGG
jgi:N-acetylmuramoyl-L-alanine amidase